MDGEGLEEDWRRIGGGLEEDLRRIGGGLEEDWRRNLWGRSNWLKMTKNNFLRFLAFYPLISAFQAFSYIASDRA